MSEKPAHLRWDHVPSFVPVRQPPNHKDYETLQLAAGAQAEYDKGLKQDTVWKCSGHKGCGSMLRVADTDFIQTYWYESPHGCTGGDNWWPGEGVAVCGHCGKRNRLYNSPELMALKPYFKSVTREDKG